MKKSLLNLGRALNRNEQQQINGGMSASFGTCGCSSDYVLDVADGGWSNGRECSYEPTGAGGFPGARCYGKVENGMCCPY
ncbi:hypothetical protein [Aquimarina sp. 2201CG5-10]|uniref:hypothetical protein n=1 Tax=Aquimarina callyspongiae TaxID=3098150 RepID=UPI002AB49A76|nr:hypothetical protein [Aquimarina sp. 2201CG5-10]MDY8136932.1 hypothetical protein [Aquimarina sp. 2201CG5-10]